MNRGWSFQLGMGSLALAGVALFLTYIWFVPSIHPYAVQEQQGTLVNPVLSLTDREALADFDGRYVFFLLYYAKAYTLHALPLSGETPRLNIDVEGEHYRAEVVKGVITVRSGSYSDADVTITSTKAEVIRLLRVPLRISASFTDGRSSVTLHASRATLFSKGYLRLYDSFYDSGIARGALHLAES